MYASLVNWCKFPIKIHHKTGQTAGGDVSYTSEEVKSYRVDKTKAITDKTGKEYISMQQIYLPPETNITIDDRLSFDGSTKKLEIKGLNAFYDGEDGLRSIWVVYL